MYMVHISQVDRIINVTQYAFGYNLYDVCRFRQFDIDALLLSLLINYSSRTLGVAVIQSLIRVYIHLITKLFALKRKLDEK
jgi:hypothetical protein